MNIKQKLNIKFILLLLSFVMLVCGMISNPLQAKAATVSSTSLSFDEHKGMVINISGVGDAFCIERGYPFRTKVSDLQNFYVTVDGETKTLAAFIRENLKFQFKNVDAEDPNVTGYFAGWGYYKLNADHTGVINITTSSQMKYVPSSGAWSENFDEEISDDEDTYTTGKDAGMTYDFDKITGHEGSKDPYSTEMVQITNTLDSSRLNALAIANYYIFEDASDFSATAKRQVAQTLSWCAEFGFLDTTGSGTYTTVTFNTSTGKYKSGGSMTSGTMSCDTYVQKYIGGQYDAMKLYRQFVWKMTNLRTIPSFAYNNGYDASQNPIHLKWDATENAYVARVSDENGVLDYFNFTLSGITVTDNGDGSLTLKSANPINGTITSNASTSTLLPSDCMFELPVTYRWDLEGEDASFVCTFVKPDYSSETLYRWGPNGQQRAYNCSHSYNPACNWYCSNSGYDKDYCTGKLNDGWVNGYYLMEVWYPGYYTKHTCKDDSCKHKTYCPYYGKDNVTNVTPTDDDCKVYWYCAKEHLKLIEDENGNSGIPIGGKFQDFQDLCVWGQGSSVKLVDPVYAYISVVTDEHITYESETNAEVQLIDKDGNVASTITPGEMYKIRYIFTYEGDSKGFKINKANINKTYYSFPYTTRMTTNSSIYSLRSSYASGESSTPHGYLYINETTVQMRGSYTLGQQYDGENVNNVYPDNNYVFNSGTSWYDTIALDALTTEVSDDGYTNLTADEVKATSDHSSKVEVTKTNNKIKVTWTFDTDYEVFTSSYINITGYINVGANSNYSKDYFTAKYNYGETENHNYAGDYGYFDRHTIVTKNSEYQTYALKNKVFHSNMDLKVYDVALNSGAGITQPMYQKVGTSYHDMNFNLYYTLKLTHTRAYIYERLVTKANNGDVVYHEAKQTDIDTSKNNYEFDVNTKIDLALTGDAFTTQNLSFVSVDHIKSNDEIYIQKVIPVRIPIIANGKTTKLATVEAKVTTNYDRMLYEDYYTKPVLNNNGLKSTLTVRTHSGFYLNNNDDDAKDYIYTAMDPNTLRPTTIKGSNNVNSSKYSSSTPTTFNIKLANGSTASVKDSDTKSYTQYEFAFNTGKKVNQITFPSYRQSASMFKYSATSYKYNDTTIKAATGSYTSSTQSQTERYYISEVLFKSNYTSKYNLGANKDGWVDMVNNNANAIVVAGQGFELQVTVKYENTLLTQYLTRYIKDSGYTGDDGQNTTVGSSAYKTPQYCNISPLTVGYNESNSKVGYLSGFTTTDRLFAKMLESVTYKVMTGSNVYSDLYVYMSDNKDTVYSYSGIYDTPIIFERKITYSSDFSVVTMVYTMKQSTENGVTSSFQNMKFYTNSLASNSESAGIITNNKDVQATKQHSITLWTPIITATDFNYPNDKGTRYIGDAIEIGYTITTDLESITHIVQ